MARHAPRAATGRTRRDRESGQALLELALVTPILVLLVMAIFQFAFVLESQVGLTNAVREAARRAASTTTATPAWSGPGSLQEWVQIELCGNLAPPCDGGLLNQNVQAFDGSKLWTDPPAVTFCSYSVGSDLNYRVTVHTKYKHPLFFGPLAFATDALDGSSNGYWDLEVSAQMRLENADVTTNDPGACP